MTTFQTNYGVKYHAKFMIQINETKMKMKGLK